MKSFWIKPGTRQRAMVRTSTVEIVSGMAPVMKNKGMTEVGFPGFWKHVLFWWVKRNRDKREAERNAKSK